MWHQSKLTIGCTFPAPLTEVHKTRTGADLSYFTVLVFAHLILKILSLAVSAPIIFQRFLVVTFFIFSLNWGKQRMLNCRFSEQIIQYSHEKNINCKVVFPLCLQENLSVPKSVFKIIHFSFPSDSNHCFWGLFNSQFKRKQQLFCFKFIQPWRWGIYQFSITLEQAAVYFSRSVRAVCFAQLCWVDEPESEGVSDFLPQYPFKNPFWYAASLPWGF